LALENFPYEPEPRKAWVRFGVHPNIQQAEEVGGRTERMEGTIWFQIFVPEYSGTAEASKIADVLKVMFFEHHIIAPPAPTVMCRAAPLHYVGNDGSGWEQHAVWVPYIAFAQVPLPT